MQRKQEKYWTWNENTENSHRKNITNQPTMILIHVGSANYCQSIKQFFLEDSPTVDQTLILTCYILPPKLDPFPARERQS